MSLLGQFSSMMCCSLPFRLHLLVSNSHDHDLIQVGDRGHLLNLLETLIKLLEHYRGTMREVARPSEAVKAQLSDPHDSEDRQTAAALLKQHIRERRFDLYQRMRELIDNGRSQVQVVAALASAYAPHTMGRFGRLSETQAPFIFGQVDALGPYPIPPISHLTSCVIGPG
jgi:hypothetical protein